VLSLTLRGMRVWVVGAGCVAEERPLPASARAPGGEKHRERSQGPLCVCVVHVGALVKLTCLSAGPLPLAVWFGCEKLPVAAHAAFQRGITRKHRIPTQPTGQLYARKGLLFCALCSLHSVSLPLLTAQEALKEASRAEDRRPSSLCVSSAECFVARPPSPSNFARGASMRAAAWNRQESSNCSDVDDAGLPFLPLHMHQPEPQRWEG